MVLTASCFFVAPEGRKNLKPTTHEFSLKRAGFQAVGSSAPGFAQADASRGDFHQFVVGDVFHGLL